MIILKRNKIAILGSNGFIGRGLQSHFNKFDFEVMPFSSKNINNAIQWDYKSKIPDKLFDNKIIIDCARSSNATENIRRVKRIIRNLPKKSFYIFFSSKAIKKSPKDSLLPFRGDDYIREKKVLTNFLINKKNIVIVYPDIVLGQNGNWDKIVEKIISAEVIEMPNKGNNDFSYIEINNLCNQIVSSIQDDSIFLKDWKLKSKKRNWKSLTEKRVMEGSENLYFDSFLKNLVVSVLNSVLIPDFLNFKIMSFLRNRENNFENQSSSFSPTGMTRFYMSDTNDNGK